MLVACGISPNRLLQVTLLPAAVIAVLVGLCSLWLTPAGAAHNERLIDEQQSRLDFSLLTPGRFQDFGDDHLFGEVVDITEAQLADARHAFGPGLDAEITVVAVDSASPDESQPGVEILADVEVRAVEMEEVVG